MLWHGGAATVYSLQKAIRGTPTPSKTRGLKLWLASAPEVLLLQTPRRGPPAPWVSPQRRRPTVIYIGCETICPAQMQG